MKLKASISAVESIVPARVSPKLIAVALAGLLSGGAFSLALEIAGLRRTFDEMSLPLFAVGGALAPLPIFAAASGGELFVLGHVVPATIWALLGAGCAAGSLAVARMADDAELLKAGEELSDIGLTKDERRELLGTEGAV